MKVSMESRSYSSRHFCALSQADLDDLPLPRFSLILQPVTGSFPSLLVLNLLRARSDPVLSSLSGPAHVPTKETEVAVALVDLGEGIEEEEVVVVVDRTTVSICISPRP